MPKRANDWQAVLTAVQKHLAPGSVVTESKMLRDRVDGQSREVDVCVEGSIGAHALLIGVEGVDRVRKADLPWVEYIAKKHETLPTDRVILAARAGFTGPAKDKAERLGMVTVTLEELDDADFGQLIAGKLETLYFQLTRMRLTGAVVQLQHDDSGEARTEELPADTMLYDAEGNEMMLLGHFVAGRLRLPDVLGVAAQQGPGTSPFTATWTPELKKADTGEVFPVYVRDLADNRLWRMDSITAKGERIAPERTPIPLTQGRLDDARVSWGAIPVDGREYVLTTVETPDGRRSSFMIPRDRNSAPLELKQAPPLPAEPG